MNTIFSYLKSIILSFIKRYEIKNRKIEMKTKLQDLEYSKSSKGQWKVTIELVTDILNIIDDELVPNDISLLNSYYVISGFKNSTHCLNTLILINQHIKKREKIPFELLASCDAKRKLSLDNFLKDNNNKRVDIRTFLNQVRRITMEIRNSISLIQDPMYRDRAIAAVTPVCIDLISPIEVICGLGVSDEQ